MKFLADLWHRHQKLRFLVIGAWNTLFGYLVFVVFYHFVGNKENYVLLALAAHFIAVCNAFICHKYFVFRSGQHWFLEFLRFNLSYLFSLALGLILLVGLVEILHLHPIFAQAITLTISVAVSYFAHKHFSFRIGKAKENEAKSRNFP